MPFLAKKVKNNIKSLSDDSSLTTLEKDGLVITIVTVDKLGGVRDMIWLLFSILPAVVILIMIILTRLYPIKK